MAKIKSRNRIVEYRVIPANQIQDNPKNWRTHPDAQREAMADILTEIGTVGVAMVRKLDNGNYELVDGHLRKSLMADVPCVVVDLDESEADLILATHDPLAGMASSSPDKLGSLMKDLNTSSQSLSDLLTSMAEAHKLIPQDVEKATKHKRPGGDSEDLPNVRTIYQYPLIFDDENQQATWFQLIRHLAERHPNLPSIGSRLARFIEDFMESQTDDQ